MNNIKTKILTFCLLLFVIFLSACLDDIVPPPLTGELNKTAKMLMIFEENGDFINTYFAPPLVTAQELYNDSDNYIILDVRNNDLFVAGHIENAINISIHDLYNFINNLTDSVNTSIVLVSKNGQASAFYATLLRLEGIENIYSLKYGMASWHFDFAEEWLDAIGDDPTVMSYTNDVFPRNEFMDFPILEEFKSDMSISEIIETRIQMLISNGFYSDETHIRNMPLGNEENYIVCYGNSSLYLSPEFEGIGFGHPVSAVSYRDDPWYELRSFKYLQTLPPNKDIIVYSYNGQLSACVVAYLNVLGYSAKSLLFGTNQLFHTRMIEGVALNEFAFTSPEIMNYDYVTGQ